MKPIQGETKLKSSQLNEYIADNLLSPKQAAVYKHISSGCTLTETARMLNVDKSSVYRTWRRACREIVKYKKFAEFVGRK